jgi:4-hydroxy-3-polyprenylbenzoate decarboxylase
MEARSANPSAAAPRPVPERLIVAMTGVEGARYGIGLLEALRRTSVESHLIMCPCARQSIRTETGKDPDLIRKLASRSYHPHNQAAKISSGSFLTKGMVIAPCSVRSMSAIVNGYATTLVARAADVTLKERRPLVLLVNESPLSPIQAENLRRASAVPGVVVAWPGQQADDEVVNGLLAQFAIPRELLPKV